MLEIPYQKVYLAGREHDITVTLTIFDTLGLQHIRETKGFFAVYLSLTVDFSYTHRLLTGLRDTACGNSGMEFHV